MSSKIDIRDIVRLNYKTLYDDRNGRPRVRDYLLFLGVPLSVATLPFWTSASLSSTRGLLAAVSVTGGLLFALMIMVLQMAADTAARAESQGVEAGLLRRVKVLRELSANVSYTVLVAIFSTVVLATGEFLLPSGTAPIPGRQIVEPQPEWFTALVVFILSHFLITLLMVLKRTFSVTRSELDLASVPVSRH
jgi:hypothetical protein